MRTDPSELLSSPRGQRRSPDLAHRLVLLEGVEMSEHAENLTHLMGICERQECRKNSANFVGISEIIQKMLPQWSCPKCKFRKSRK